MNIRTYSNIQNESEKINRTNGMLEGDVRPVFFFHRKYVRKSFIFSGTSEMRKKNLRATFTEF